MKNVKYYFGLFILLTVIACAKSPESAMMEMAAQAKAPSTDEPDINGIVERKLIKEGHITFETDDINTARKTIFKTVDQYKANVSSDQESKSLDRKSNTLVIRIPVDDFDNFLTDAIKGVEKLERKSINTKNVTEEFLDVETRLKTKKELETRYLVLLKQAKNVIEIVEIEKQIGLLRTEIESIEGRLNYLQNQVAFATLTTTFYERIPNKTAFGQKFQNSFKNGWDNLIWFFVFLTNIWPFILVVVGLLLGIRWYRNKLKKSH
ncbi:DUF4349 domain-containing protein [Maribacter sp. 4G9]|uniref:DUF4349 domain-containing protein n=1 Tax=Maribacter sp. 4G9 TaxID=1889777 RepID=UPI000C14C217|nr:DUF4349 domain-containing protein [Maribacter sp. 4G9]PIB38410.1 hypothetical protein BFP75_16005 [Maribacter sp. 4G9]